VTSQFESLPSDLAAAHAMILAERAARLEAETIAASAQAKAASAQAEAANAKAQAATVHADLSATEALISRYKLEIEKLRRQLYGTRSERKARLLEQMELQLEELEAAATEDELAAEQAAAQTQNVTSFRRRRPSRKPFPDHLPRERVVIAAPKSCPCCGSSKLAKLGEDITETLEVVPRQWKVIQTVREKFSCRTCEAITQPPAPFHVTPRGFAGPNLLAMILFEKFGQHQPLNRQSERYAQEGIDLSVSTLADQVGACAAVMNPLYALIERHVLAAERLHGDDTNVPILAKGKTIKGHIWAYVRDDRPFGADARRRRRSTTPRAIAAASILPVILAASAASCRPTPMAATTSCTIPRAPRDPSLRPCAGPTRAGSSSISPISPPMRAAAGTRRRSRRLHSTRSSASTCCSISSAASMDRAPRSACEFAGSRARRCWRHSRAGCANSARACRAHPPSPDRSITCCAAGIGSLASLRMVGSVSPTMRPSARCAGSRSDANPGSSQDRSAGPTALLSWRR
jgi:transposase